jgi:hypothetical protein
MGLIKRQKISIKSKHIAYLFSDERMLLGDGVFQPADVIFQNFALVAAQLPRNRFAALIVAERESGEAKRRHRVLGAALRQVPAPIQRHNNCHQSPCIHHKFLSHYTTSFKLQERNKRPKSNLNGTQLIVRVNG